MSRVDHLLGGLAEAFADGRTFDGFFLREHHVTANECRDLENRLATILKGYLNAPRHFQNIVLASSVVEPGMAISTDDLWYTGALTWVQQENTRGIAALSAKGRE